MNRMAVISICLASGVVAIVALGFLAVQFPAWREEQEGKPANPESQPTGLKPVVSALEQIPEDPANPESRLTELKYQLFNSYWTNCPLPIRQSGQQDFNAKLPSL